jgi:putative ABC transport system substrate-binding protein
MRRREFIGLAGSATMAWPLDLHAQQPDRVRRIGVLIAFDESDTQAEALPTAFRAGLQTLG